MKKNKVGRPKLKEKRVSTSITVTLEHNALLNEKNKEGISKSFIVEKALNIYFNFNKED